MKNTHTLMHGIKLYRRYVRKYNRLKAIHAPLAKLEFLKKRILKLQHCLCSVLKPKNIAVTGCMMTASALTAQNYDNAISYPFGMAVLPGTYTCPAVADIDNDGDVDVFTGESGGNFAYWQNTGTLTAPAFGSPVGNPFGLTNIGYYSKPVFADLDNDGDQDMMSGETYGDFYYFQNTGTASAPAFAAPVTNPFGLSNAGYYTTPAFVDLDNDGDLDMLSGLEDGSLIYYQNTGTVSAPAFAAGITNPFGLSMGPSVYDSKPAFADLDGDGDQDMLSGDQYGDFYYFLNTGTATAPAFAAPSVNPFNLQNMNAYTAPAFTDLDGDGDLDLLAGHDAGKIIYFEDTTSCAPPNVATTIAGVTITAAFAGADSYQWVVCPGMAVAAGVSTNQSYTATTNGDYAVIITEMGCSDTSACVTINSVGISEWTDENEISVFPNPNNGSFTISGVTDANLLFLLQNETGQVVQRIRLNPNNNYHFTVENLANGVYFIRQEGSGLNKRIVVIK